MAKGQKALQQTSTDRSKEQYQIGHDAEQRLITGTPEWQAWSGRIDKRREAIDKGNYAEAPDFLSNKANRAEQTRQYQANKNIHPTGVGGAALANADTTQVALTNKILDDTFQYNLSKQAEDDARGYVADTNTLENQRINTQIGNNQFLAGMGMDQSNINIDRAQQIAAQRNQAFMQMIGMGISGASSIFSMGRGAMGGAPASAGGIGGGSAPHVSPTSTGIASQGHYGPR